jgi:hypothetical protein
MNSPALIGRLVAVVLFGCLAGYFLILGLKGGPRSRRLANFALFCGLTAFVMPEIVLTLMPDFRTRMLFWSGVTRIILGIAGLAFGVAALFVRRDKGVSIARPITGIGFSLLHTAMALGLIVLGQATQPPTPSSQWVYQAPDAAYHLTLPSPEWNEAPPIGGKGEISFFVTLPRMHCTVLTLMRDQTDQDFFRVADAFRDLLDRNTRIRDQATHHDGINAAGNRYRFGTGIEEGPNGQKVFLAHSVTWCSQKKLIVRVIFEGAIAMKSQIAKEAEVEAMTKAAETICLSVE